MAGGSTLDPDNFPRRGKKTPEGHDTKALGPSDSSDSGSDMAGPGLVGKIDQLGLDRGTNQDIEGGALNSADAGPSTGDVGVNADRGTDRVVGADEAGLGGGLDQAEEARAGETQGERDERSRSGRTPDTEPPKDKRSDDL